MPQVAEIGGAGDRAWILFSFGLDKEIGPSFPSRDLMSPMPIGRSSRGLFS
jgi:hypothetical protein